MILIAGDIHANFDLFFERVANLSTRPTAILQVGDLGGKSKEYPDFPTPTYFIQGNHENWDLLYGKGEGAEPLFSGVHSNSANIYVPRNLHHLPNGRSIDVEGLCVVGLGGNYSSKYYVKGRSEMKGDRRRHFNYSEVLMCDKDSIEMECEMDRTFSDRECPPFHGVDILLTHEAPSPYMNRGRNCGIGKINEAIRNAEPELHFFGHHHHDGDYEYEGVKSYGLGMGYNTGILLDPKTLELERISLE